MKRLTLAQIAIREPDVVMIEDGGKSDFDYGKNWQVMGQPPVEVDRVLRSGETVRLGEVILTVTTHRATPGELRPGSLRLLKAATRITTSCFKTVQVLNPGYQIAKPEEYPGINQLEAEFGFCTPTSKSTSSSNARLFTHSGYPTGSTPCLDALPWRRVFASLLS